MKRYKTSHWKKRAEIPPEQRVPMSRTEKIVIFVSILVFAIAYTSIRHENFGRQVLAALKEIFE